MKLSVGAFIFCVAILPDLCFIHVHGASVNLKDYVSGEFIYPNAQKPKQNDTAVIQAEVPELKKWFRVSQTAQEVKNKQNVIVKVLNLPKDGRYYEDLSKKLAALDIPQLEVQTRMLTAHVKGKSSPDTVGPVIVMRVASGIEYDRIVFKEITDFEKEAPKKK